MADSSSTPAPSPVWDFLKSMTPSLNTCLVLIVTALIAALTTFFTTVHMTGPKLPMTAADKPSVVTPAQLAAARADILDRMARLQRTNDEIRALVEKLPTTPPPPPAPATKALKKAALK